MRTGITVQELADELIKGKRRALARLITLVENDHPSSEQALKKLYPYTGHAHIIGVTGSPGAGKSTLVNALAKEIRKSGNTVGIIAVDPTSPYSGGAVLGDRIRMRDLAGDEGIFIRSMASRGSLGGLARATSDVVKLFDAAGFDLIIIETVGAGQSEVEIAKTAHTTLVIQVPGMGDDVQAIKAGILEIADILVVNKADRPGAENTVKTLQMMQHLGRNNHRYSRHHSRLFSHKDSVNQKENENSWEPPIIKTVGTTGEGVRQATESIKAHWNFLHDSGQLQERNTLRIEQEFEMILGDALLSDLRNRVPKETMEDLLHRLVERSIDPYTAVRQLVKET